MNDLSKMLRDEVVRVNLHVDGVVVDIKIDGASGIPVIEFR